MQIKCKYLVQNKKKISAKTYKNIQDTFQKFVKEEILKSEIKEKIYSQEEFDCRIFIEFFSNYYSELNNGDRELFLNEFLMEFIYDINQLKNLLNSNLKLSQKIYIEYFLETFNISSIWDLILELVIFLFFTLLYYCAYSIITYLLSITVCTYKSRNIPVEFRQKFRNNEPFLATAFIGSFFVIIMGIYGYAAHHKTWLPNAGPTLLNLLFKSLFG